MPIKIYLGNVGSGKTASCVREMYLNKEFRATYSNIKSNIKGMRVISPEMIAKRELIDTKKKRDGTTEPVYKLSMNTEFWKEEIKKHKHGINVIIDEAHSVLNARRAMSKANIIISDWLALIRRVLGSSDAGHGDLILISQLPRRLDPIARDMATQIRYHICYYRKTCKKCSKTWTEHSELPEPFQNCPYCNSFYLKKHSHKILVLHFDSFNKFEVFKELTQPTYYKRYFVLDIEKYFPMYDTLQWDNLFSELYN